MIKLFKLTRNAWIAFFVALVAAFIMSSTTYAQTTEENPEEIAQKYGITFPIEELGSCQNYSECRSFCEDPVNSTTCINFAKAKGFYKEEQTDVTKGEILEKAKQTLGCDSHETCRNFCQIPSNFEKCDSFAKQNNLTGGHVNNPEEKRILVKAKEVLGCDSPATCAAFCSDEANRQKCSQFAKEVGLRGGEQRVGPGGCTSAETCRAFCSDPQNYSVCSGFASSSGGKFQGPGGCNSEESCRAYCQDHENECRSLGGPGGPPPGYNPQEMCNRTPNCSWNNNTCTCSSNGFDGREDNKERAQEYARICRENPSKCTPGGVGGFESKEDRATFEKYCRENPDKCRPAYSNYTGGADYDPATVCGRYAGCSWVNNSCQCSNSTGGTPSSGTSYNPGSTNPVPNSGSSGSYTGGSTGYTNTQYQYEDPATACARGGCSWTGSSCNCPSGSGSSGSTSTSYSPQPTSTTQTTSEPQPAPVQESQPAPQPAPVQEPAPAPAPEPTVQGIAIVRGFLDQILDFFRR
ncbi:MAG: hypothetical protein HYW45_03745 [Candidatus Daviesbacteria bacterium]|nr:MAG: hypothetical protein HYW45_03745 [Candidatus Daviesbacteria bacterium]